MSTDTQQTGQDGSSPQQPAAGLLRGSVTQVLSGDTVVIQGQGRPGTAAQEIQVTLSGINSPRLGRPKARDGRDGTSDEPFAWDARERLRKLLIGQEVRFSLDPPPGGPMSKAPVTAASLAGIGGGDDNRQQRKYATVYIRGDNGKPTNVAEILVSEGLVKLSSGAARQETLKELVRREEEAKNAHVGMHGDDSERQARVRDVKSSIENSSEFLSKYQKVPLKGVVEFVRDGSSVKVSTYAPDHMSFMVEMTGIRSPNVNREGKTEPFTNEAVEFTRSRLLHRDVELVVEGIRPNGQTVNATLKHPLNDVQTIYQQSGCFEELLLKNGLAKISDSISKYTGDVEKLRAAEKAAKAKKLGIWKNAEPERERSSAQAKVIEVISPDAYSIKTGDQVQKIYLAGVRFRRGPGGGGAAGGAGPEGGGGDDAARKPQGGQRAAGAPGGGSNRPIYEIPYFFEAREMLRKMLVGKNVKVVEEYTQEGNEKFPERKCYSLKCGNIDPAVELARKGYIEIVKFRQDDKKRPSNYDQLLAAEAEAKEAGIGIHSGKTVEPMRINDASTDGMKARTLSNSLKQTSKLPGVIEFVSSASRYRVYVPRENCLIGVVLAGVQVPRVQRNAKGEVTKHDPVAEAAYEYARELAVQRDVTIQIVDMDKMGNFIGWITLPNKKLLNEELLKAGYGQVHFSAEGKEQLKVLQEAEAAAKKEQLGMWKDYVEPTPEERQQQENDRRREQHQDQNGDALGGGGGGDQQQQRGGATSAAGGGWGAKPEEVKRIRVVVTEVAENLKFYAQKVQDGPQLDALMSKLRNEMKEHPPVSGAYTARKGKCVAQFSYDKQWYRAVVEKIDKEASGEKKMLVRFIDYGNTEMVPITSLANLPAAFESLPPQAQEYTLALVRDASAEDAIDSRNALLKAVLNREMLLEPVRINQVSFARLFPVVKKQDQQQQQQQQQPSTSSAAAAAATSSDGATDEIGGSSSISAASKQQQQQPKAADQGDIGLQLIKDGLVLFDEKPGGRFLSKQGKHPDFIEQYRKAQEEAKNAHTGIWKYGDPTPDDF